MFFDKIKYNRNKVYFDYIYMLYKNIINIIIIMKK